MIRIGITGGIGSGKSVVASLLTAMGAPVYQADSEGKRLSNVLPEIRETLQSLFGNNIYKDGRLDRRRLAALIFTDDVALQQVNAIIHPVVKQDFRAWQQTLNCPVCAIESAVLYEAGFSREVDRVWLVSAPEALKLSRAIARDGVAEDDIRRRMKFQLSEEAKRQHADYVIVNDDVRALIPQVEACMKTL